MAVTIYERYAVQTALTSLVRSSPNYLHFLCDTEAELPSSNVLNGDTAYTNDSSKRWIRSSGSWALYTTDSVSCVIQTTTGPTSLSIGAVADGTYLQRVGSTLVGATPIAVAAWGGITGTLSTQTDLQTALDTKLVKSSNLSDLTNTGTARTNLGLGTLATQSGTFSGTTSGTNTGDQTITLTGDVTGSGTGSFATAIKSSVSLTTPVIGAATGTSLAATGAITSSGTAGIGYATGAGGTVSQLTSKSTGVTLNKLCGTITMHNAALAAAATVTFTVTNSTVAATDVIFIQHDTIGAIGSYTVMPNTSAAGSFKISVRNNTAGSLGEAIVLRFAVIKSVVS